MTAAENGAALWVAIFAPYSDLSAKDANGKTALQLALGNKQWSSIDALIEFLPLEAARAAVLSVARDILPKTAARAEALDLQEAANAVAGARLDAKLGADPSSAAQSQSRSRSRKARSL